MVVGPKRAHQVYAALKWWGSRSAIHGGWLRRSRKQDDGETEFVEASDECFGGAVFVDAVEVPRAEFVVALTRLENRVGRDRYTVGDRDLCLLLRHSRAHAIVLLSIVR